MAEVADAIDLGSIVNRRAGSSPVIRIGTSGDTELFEKPSNINGFRASEQKNILYISPH